MSVFVSSNVWLVEFRTSSAKLVALCMADAADENGKCWPANRTIAARCQLSIETVKATVMQLEEDGWIRREPFFRRNGSQGASTTRFDLDKLDRHGRKAKAELLEASRCDRRDADEELESFVIAGGKAPRGEGERLPRGGVDQIPPRGVTNTPGGGEPNTPLEPSVNRQLTVMEPLSPEGDVGVENTQGVPRASREPQPLPTTRPDPKVAPAPAGGGETGKPAKARNPAWDALADIEGHGGNPSPLAAGGIGRALKAIRGMMPGADLDAVAAEIRRRAANWASHFEGATITAMALAKWWSRMEAAQTKASKPGGWSKFAKERDASLQGDWQSEFERSATANEPGKTV